MADLSECLRILGVSDNATLNEAHSAWRLRSEVLHPDRLAGTRPEVQAEAENQLKELNEAWRIVRLDLTRSEPHVAYAYFGGTRPSQRRDSTTASARRAGWSRESRSVFALAILVALSSAFLGYQMWTDSHRPTDYPALTQSDFISACETTGSPLTTCRCQLDRVMDQVPYDEFVKSNGGSGPIDQIPSEVDIGGCA